MEPSIDSKLEKDATVRGDGDSAMTSWLKKLTLHQDEIASGKDVHRLEFLEDTVGGEAKSVGPSWGARICYGAGTTYLTGLATGGTWGLYEGLTNPLGRGSRKLRINAILNACTRRGPLLGNSFASLSIFYNLLNGGIIYLRDGEEDVRVSSLSAGVAGYLFRSTAGVRNATVAGACCSAAVIAYNLYKDPTGVKRALMLS